MPSPDLHAYAQRELRRRTHPDVLLKDLTDQGFSPAQAAALISAAQADLEETRRRPADSLRAARRAKRRNRILSGVAMIVGGIAVYILTALSTGGFAMVMWGLMLVGLLRILQGLHGTDEDQDSDWRF